MASIHKISGYLVDIYDYYSNEGVYERLFEGFEALYRHFHIETADIGEWEDDNPLNYRNCDLAHCEKYFKEKPTTDKGREVEVGALYRHFKEGKIVKVLAVSQDTENVGSYSVVYECKDKDNNTKIWHRPYDMFVSEVDREKYPEAKQKYRFEKIENVRE